MTIFTISSILVGLSALFGYLNYRFLHLPHTIGLVVIALFASLATIGLDLIEPSLQIAQIVTDEIRQIDQWFKMNKANNKDEWLKAMEMRAIVSFNAVYADKEDNIMLLHNTSGPIRNENYDWTKPVDGTNSLLVWDMITPFEEIPLLTNPSSGWIASVNQDPFRASAVKDNLKRSNYSSTLGIETKMTNRAFRIIEIFDNDKKFSEQDLLNAKFDNAYSKKSRSLKYLEDILQNNFNDVEVIHQIPQQILLLVTFFHKV